MFQNSVDRISSDRLRRFVNTNKRQNNPLFSSECGKNDTIRIGDWLIVIVNNVAYVVNVIMFGLISDTQKGKDYVKDYVTVDNPNIKIFGNWFSLNPHNSTLRITTPPNHVP